MKGNQSGVVGDQTGRVSGVQETMRLYELLMMHQRTNLLPKRCKTRPGVVRKKVLVALPSLTTSSISLTDDSAVMTRVPSFFTRYAVRKEEDGQCHAFIQLEAV